MSLVNRHCRVVASVLLVLAAFGAALAVSFAQGATGVEAQRRAAALERQRTEQRRSVERARAHARMPDTMYASTPDGAPPPHAVPLDVKRPSPPEHPATEPPVSPPVTPPGHRIALFVSAAGASGSQGVARIINRSAVGGEVRIEGYDDAGVRHGPVRLRLGAGEAVHLSAAELERGHAAKGLVGRFGVGEGDWRLEVASALDLEVLGYLRTRDGFLTAMHDVVPEGESGHRVVLFNAGSNVVQASRLRIVNPGTEAAAVRIEGIDDAGVSSHRAVTLTLGAGAARTLTARVLESGGAGLVGALGTGTGRWRLLVTADRPLEVMSLIASASGHLVNVSTAPAAVGGGESGAGAVHRVAWLPAAARWRQGGVRGLLRLVNHTRSAGEVRIEAFDDAGVQAPGVTVAVGAHEAVELTSAELEGGSAAKGLSGGIGAGEGDWWLRLTTGLEVEVLAYVQAQDGLVSSVHDVVPRVGGVHRVRVFNPASETSQTSRLRIVNPGAKPVEVRIEGIDDAGVSSPGAVTLTLGAGAARTLGAAQLESGEGVSGGLGDGAGRWRLMVSADAPIEVMSPLTSPTGHLTNLSTAPGTAASQTAAEVFAERISEPVVQTKCIACHTAGGAASLTRLHFERASSPAHQALNLKAFEDFVAEVDDGADYLLNKIQGVGHGGGKQVAAGTAEFTAMERFLALLGKDVTSVAITPQTLFDTVTMAPARKTLRRAALIFAGRNPTDAEYRAAQRGGAALRATIRGLMTGPQFHEFLIRGANDRLLTDRDEMGIVDTPSFVDYARERYRLHKAAHASGNFGEAYDWTERVDFGASRAPLELIAHVVENDRPYTEILTADYIMANPWTAVAYGASTRFEDPTDVNEFKPSKIATYHRRGDGFEAEYDQALFATRIIDPGPLITDYPHAGILNTTNFLLRYPTTATNRNRARSRWTYYHFLGLDIEKSAPRTTDPVALADTNNPTLLNPACTVCHSVLDPVAGAFQNYGDEGWYKDRWGGVDSLDEFYKNDAGTSLEIRADSWRNRETLSWSLPLAAGTQTLRVVFANDFYEEDTGLDGNIFLDRLTVTDPGGRSIHGLEFENLEAPVAHWGRCGSRHYNRYTGREDHFALWGGHIDCALYIDVRVPKAGVHDVEIVAWSNGRFEQFGGDGYARIAVAVNPYRQGDTWYRDMRPPGFADKEAPNSDNSVQWLAEQIVADERFAEATVKFWWPAIMGSEVAEPPEDTGDADFEGRLLAANAQGAEVERLADGFRRGFRGRARYNLKDLLVEIVLSKWFRADAVEDADPVRGVALHGTGARRLLTPEELARKTASLTGVQWGRHISTAAFFQTRNALDDEYRLLYGGIDSAGITKRARDVTTVMAGVAKRHAVEASCLAVMRELYLLPDAERRLFAGIDQYVTPSRGAARIRSKLVELYDKLLGVQVTPHSPDVEAAYRLFADVVENGPRSRDDRVATYREFQYHACHWWRDVFLFEGILDDAVVENVEESGYRWYSHNGPVVDNFLRRIDWSDPHHAARAWVVVLAYLFIDYRYLYL